jgi:hypothetical protein
MAIRKSAPKSTAKKAARPEKKAAAAKAKPAKSAPAKKSKPAKAKDTKDTKDAKNAKDSKARSARKPEASAASTAKKAPKATKPAAATPESDKATARSRAKGAAKKPATPAPAAPTPSQAKRGRGKGAAKVAAPAPPAPPARKRSAGPPRTVAVTVGSAIVSKLGRKWNCFQCGASFYDLNRPEPLCPKCGADQRQRPKVSASGPAHPPAPRKQPRPMAPLLDDEDDGTVRYDEEFDLGVRTDIDDAEQDLFQPGDAEEEDVFGGDEE